MSVGDEAKSDAAPANMRAGNVKSANFIVREMLKHGTKALVECYS